MVLREGSLATEFLLQVYNIDSASAGESNTGLPMVIIMAGTLNGDFGLLSNSWPRKAKAWHKVALLQASESPRLEKGILRGALFPVDTWCH